MDIDYAHEKLSAAVYCLVTGVGRIQERLAGAAFCFMAIKPDCHFSDVDLRNRIIAICDKVTVPINAV